MGLLDDLGPLLKGRPKILPFGANIDPTAFEAVTAGDELDPTMKARHAEALEVRGAVKPEPPGGTLAGPNQQRAFAAGDQPGAGFGPTPPQGRNLRTAVADAAPPKINLTEMDFGLGDKFPAPKNPARLAEGLPMTAPEITPGIPAASPAPATGLLANAPLPPSRPADLGGIPRTRAAAAMPLPPPRPAGLGGAEVASTAPPMPPVRPPGLGVEASGGLLSKAPAIVPPAPPIAPPIAPPTPPIAPPIAPVAAAGGAMGGAAGGAMGGLGGALGAIGSIAKAFSGGKAPPVPEARPPQLPPPRAGAEQAQQEASARSQAPQILQGILADTARNSLDPRKRRQA
jgi:hypothetical protein